MSATTITTPAPTPPLMSGDEFLKLHGDDSSVELVKGRVVRCPMPGGKHGTVCSKVSYYLSDHAIKHSTGRVMTNDTFVRTTRGPDSFRGADVCYISYARLPKEQEVPDGPVPSPELVFEVRSPSDRPKQLSDKAYEYIEAGVAVVVVLFPETQTAAIFRNDDLPVRLGRDDELTLPDVLPEFAVPVKAFFE